MSILVSLLKLVVNIIMLLFDLLMLSIIGTCSVRSRGDGKCHDRCGADRRC